MIRYEYQCNGLSLSSSVRVRAHVYVRAWEQGREVNLPRVTRPSSKLDIVVKLIVFPRTWITSWNDLPSASPFVRPTDGQNIEEARNTVRMAEFGQRVYV